jgi:hypothetical protein
LSTTAAPRAETAVPAEGAAAGRAGGDEQRWPAWCWWLGVAVAALLAWAVLTWPLAVHLDHFWTMRGNETARSQPNFSTRPGAMASGDYMQNVFIQSVVVDNLRERRNPFLDPREGAAGLGTLRTTSLDLPWMPLVGLLWPLVGLVAAYNLTLLLASVVTALAAFGWLRRHLRWPLLAAAGALAYACMPHRMFQLTSHFNAVMWWAFPAALWAFEVMVERYQAERRWRWPALGLAAVVLTVALSGEYHLTLYMTALLTFVALWAVGAALASGRPLPLGPALVALASVAAGAAYAVLVFRYAFKGAVAGENGDYEQVVLYAPASLLALVQKTFGTQGEGLVYVGWALLLLAAGGLVLAVVRRRSAILPYAALLVPLLLLTYGPRADIGPIRLYRYLFDHLPFLSMQRVPERLMVVTALVLVLLAVTAVQELGERWLARAERARAARDAAARAAAVAADGDGASAAVTATVAGGPAAGADRPGGAGAGRQEGQGDGATGQGGPRPPTGEGAPPPPAGTAPADDVAGGAADRDVAERPAWLGEGVATAPEPEQEAPAAPSRRAAERLAERWPRLAPVLAWWDRSPYTTPRRLAAGALVVATLLLLADYRVSDNRLQPDLADNRVVTALHEAGDDAGPVLGLPALKPTVTWNSATTYLAAQSRRRSLNAYNQTPANWLEDRMARLAPLNRGVVEADAMAVLQVTGTRHVLVVDEPRVFARGQWLEVVNRLVGSGAFRLVVRDGPLALLEVTGAQRPNPGGDQPDRGIDPVTQV